MHTKLTKEEFLEKENKNKEKLKKLLTKGSLVQETYGKYTFLVGFNKKGEINKSACKYCLAIINNCNPIKNGAYVYPLCIDCLRDIDTAELYRFGVRAVSQGARRTKVDPLSVEIDWGLIEKQIDNDQASTSLLAKHHKLYPAEMKELLLSHFGDDKIEFKRGRNGGVKWKNKA